MLSKESSDRLHTLGKVLQQADRIIARRPELTVSISQNAASAPAYSVGDAITLAGSHLDDIDLNKLVTIYGLNYHELAHVMYTPRIKSTLGKWVYEAGLMSAFNALEDQRIETLLVARFPSAAPYLTATVLRFLSQSKEHTECNYPLVRGRRYLPLSVRTAFRQAYKHQELIPRIAEIVDEYRLLVFPKQYGRARELIMEYALLIDPLGADRPAWVNCGGSSSFGMPLRGKPEQQRDQQVDAGKDRGEADQLDDLDITDEDIDRELADLEASDEASGDIDGDGDGDIEVDGGGSGADAWGDSDGFDDSDEFDDIDDSEGEATGSRSGVGNQNSVQKALDAMQQAMDAVANHSQVINEMRSVQSVVCRDSGEYDSDLPESKYDGRVAPPQEVVATSKRIETEFRHLLEACNPGWVRETYSGRLNINRYASGCDIDEAFDRWDEGDDSANLEVVILLDLSGSMASFGPLDNQRKQSAAEIAQASAFIIARALSRLESDCTVIGFASDSHTIYKRGERVSQMKVRYPDGGTNPHKALVEARRILNNTRRRNRVLICITDGDWSLYPSNLDADGLISDLGADGVLTSSVYLHTNWTSFDPSNAEHVENARLRFGHKAQVFAPMTNVGDLVPFMRELVASTLRARARV